MDLATIYPKRHPQTSGRVIDGEAVLILSDSSEINVLNGVGSRIFELCTGERSAAEMIDILVAEYDVSAETAKSDLQAFLSEMLAQNVLISAEKPT